MSKFAESIKLEEMAKEIEAKKKIIKEKEKFLFSEAGLKLKIKEYDKLSDEVLREKKSLARLRAKRDALYKAYHDFQEIEGVSTIPAATLCL